MIPGERTNRGSSGALLISSGDPTIWQSAQSLPIRCAPARAGVHDGAVLEVPFDRLQVVAAGPVASLAADCGVGSSRALAQLRRRVAKVAIKRDVTVQASDHPVAHVNRLAADVLGGVRVRHVTRRSAPGHAVRGVIRRQSAKRESFVPSSRPIIVTYWSLIPKAYSTIDLINLVAGTRLDRDLVVLALEVVRDLGVVRVGQGPVGKRQIQQAPAMMKGPGMAALLVVSRLLAMARNAAAPPTYGLGSGTSGLSAR